RGRRILADAALAVARSAARADADAWAVRADPARRGTRAGGALPRRVPRLRLGVSTGPDGLDRRVSPGARRGAGRARGGSAGASRSSGRERRPSGVRPSDPAAAAGGPPQARALRRRA